MPHHPAAQQIHAIGHPIGTPPARDNLAVALHRAQPLSQRVKVTLLTQAELFSNIPKRQRRVGRLKKSQNCLSARNRVSVTVSFTLSMGVWRGICSL
jgi:hypothetical protein